MERFLSEVKTSNAGKRQQTRAVGRNKGVVFSTQKGYLIIIIISPKYYETVTASPLLEIDERAFNTVYIHKQVRSHR